MGLLYCHYGSHCSRILLLINTLFFLFRKRSLNKFLLLIVFAFIFKLTQRKSGGKKRKMACERRNVYEVLRAIFVFVVHYFFIPPAVFFIAACGFGANLWGVKIFTYAITGSFSIHGLPLPDSLTSSISEIVVAFFLLSVQGIFMSIYTWLTHKDRKRRLIPYDPDTTTTTHRDDVEMNSETFDFGGDVMEDDATDL